ncbi:hypothetical protein BDD12DRAFT_870950 [Trichophaea hybrida]|nr:hypothetical protein BDD12DRAFT_870950 [Trichophaea hybrida]
MASTSATVVGSTGLVGAAILNHLLTDSSVTSVSTITRRPFSFTINDPSKLHAITEPNSDTWPSSLPGLLTSPSSTVFFSALGTTRSTAGSIDAQRKIDYDLNLALASAAKSAGVKTYVLISVTGADSSSRFAYFAIKGKLEDDVAALGFEKCVVVRPGLILGDREKPRLVEVPFRMLVSLVSWVNADWGNHAGQSCTMIAKAAIRAGMEEGVWEGRKTVDGKNGGKVWYMAMGEIVELGK